MSQHPDGNGPVRPQRPVSSQNVSKGLKVTIDSKQWKLFKRLVEVSVCVRTTKGNSGAGVVISSNGLILTAYHTLERAGRPRVHRFRLDKRNRQIVINKSHHTVDVVFVDKRADVAVLKMRHPPKTLQAAELGDSRAVDVGTAIYRVGVDEATPLACGYLMKWSRHLRIEEMAIGMPGAPGSSGGGAFDIEGRLVGLVLRAIYDSVEPSCCYAIPIHAIVRRTFRRRAVKQYLSDDQSDQD